MYRRARMREEEAWQKGQGAGGVDDGHGAVSKPAPNLQCDIATATDLCDIVLMAKMEGYGK